MSADTHRIPGAPFDLVTFDLCPRDVDKHFHLEAEWQRDVRLKSAMLPGIQKTLRETRTLPGALYTYKNIEGGRHVVIDGKHRLVALQNLADQIRCTVYALCFRIASDQEAIDLFEKLNLTVPPGLKHFAAIASSKGSEAIVLLQELLPFKVRCHSGKLPADHPERGGVPVTKILNCICCAFADLPRFDRFTFEAALAGITVDHINQLVHFTEIWEDAHGPIDTNRSRFNAGWYDVLFRIFIQNGRLPASDENWARGLRELLEQQKIHDDRKFFSPRTAVRDPDRRDFILKSLGTSMGYNKLQFDDKDAPTLREYMASRRDSEADLHVA